MQPVADQAVGDFTPGGFTLPMDTAKLQERLVGAGYSIAVTGVLDPITRAAAADFYRSAGHPVTLSLARFLDGTIFLARDDVRAWNERFGLDRRTRSVGRPLAGAGGQLDAYGNLR